MVNYINKKGKFMGVSADKWGEESFCMGVPRGGVRMWDERCWRDYERLLSML